MTAHLDAMSSPWRVVDDGHDEILLIAVTARRPGGDSDELWADLEAALELADSRLVIVDLTMATGFDMSTISVLAQVAGSAVRWRIGLCLVVPPGSPIEEYARCIGLDQLVTIFPSVPDAIATGKVGRAPADGSSLAVPLSWTPVALGG